MWHAMVLFLFTYAKWAERFIFSGKAFKEKRGHIDSVHVCVISVNADMIIWLYWLYWYDMHNVSPNTLWSGQADQNKSVH